MNQLPKLPLSKKWLLYVILYIVLEIALLIVLLRFFKFSYIFWIGFFTSVAGILIIQSGHVKFSLANIAQNAGNSRLGMRILASILLILPGFISDAAGLLLFLPPVQSIILKLVQKKLASLPMASLLSGMKRSGMSGNPFAGSNPFDASQFGGSPFFDEKNSYHQNNSKKYNAQDDIIDVEYEINPKSSGTNDDITITVKPETDNKPQPLALPRNVMD